MATDGEPIDEAAEGLEASDEDITSDTRSRAFWVLVSFYGLALTGLVAAVGFGYLSPSITVTATVDAGWVIEYLLAGLAGLLFVFLAASLLIWLPGSFMAGVVRAAYGIAVEGGYVDQNQGGGDEQ